MRHFSRWNLSRTQSCVVIALMIAGTGVLIGMTSKNEPDNTVAAPQEIPWSQFEELVATPSPGPAEIAFAEAPESDLQSDVVATKRSAAPINPAVAEKSFLCIAEKPIVRPKPRWITLPQKSEEILLAELRGSVPEVGLSAATASELLGDVKFLQSRETSEGPATAVLSKVGPEILKELPFQMGEECHLSEKEADALASVSEQIHSEIRTLDAKIQRVYPRAKPERRNLIIAKLVRTTQAWKGKSTIPAMMQILQIEEPLIRVELTNKLALSKSQAAVDALVNRAIYDLNADVRANARMALRKHAPERYRDHVLKAFGHPWPAVAWHAAETLAELDDKDAISKLVPLLDEPNPAKPVESGDGTLRIKEMVRLNHKQNCLLCHARAYDKTEPVAAIVPLPVSREYYGSVGRGTDFLVRADVTYLRQDFSAKLPAANNQADRYDYVVRTRDATPIESVIAATTEENNPPRFPQRDAVLYALQQLTGKNPGEETADWQNLVAKNP